jgi:hypothetical protein
MGVGLVALKQHVGGPLTGATVITAQFVLHPAALQAINWAV